MIDANKKSKLTGATIAGSEYPQSISFPTGAVYNQAYLDMVVNEQTQLIIERVKNEVIGSDTFKNDMTAAKKTHSDAGAGEAIAKRQLRATQRQALNKLLKELTE